MQIYYWPPDVPRQMTIDAFIKAYGTLGYEACNTFEVEQDYEKIALFEDSEKTPTHAAKQLQDGRWTSKLGDFEDIEHADLHCLEGPLYGKVSCCLRRKRQPSQASLPIF